MLVWVHRRGASGLARYAATVFVICLFVASMLPSPGASAATGAAGTAIAPGDVTTYLYGLDRTGFNAAETSITPRTASTLALRSQPAFGHSHGSIYGTGVYSDTIISAQPVIAGGRIFWGNWDGNMRAASTLDGRTIWRTQIGREFKPNCVPQMIGVASTPALAPLTVRGTKTLALYVGGGDGAMYALDTQNGRVLWRTQLGSATKGYFLWSSPAVYHGSVYMGVASIGDCPNVPGSVVKLNAATGAIQAAYAAAPPGCFGGDVWGSIAVDTADDTLYFGTGNIYPKSGPPSACTSSVVELRAGTLQLVGRWAMPAAAQVIDSDFGSTPSLFTASIGGVKRRLVGLINKNGIYYAFERNRMDAGPLWQTPRLSIAKDAIGASAWDGTRLYVATHITTVNGRACYGNFGALRALDPASGKIVWEDCLFGGPGFAPVTAVPGVVFAALGSHLYAIAPANGHEYFSYQNANYNWFYAPPIVSDGILYAANSDGKIFTFSRHGR